MSSFEIKALLTGKVQSFGPRGAPSGIEKTPVREPIYLGLPGFTGDAQGDTKHHGGPEKAVHHYPLDHYPSWISEMGDRDVLTRPGAFGENFATLGLTEDSVAIGDVFSVGEAIIEVSQGRQPCWKLNHRFSTKDMAARVQASGRTGWYYRVLTPGYVAPMDRLVLVDRSSPDWTIRRIWRTFYVDKLDASELEALASLPKLADSWRQHATRRLITGKVEDWTKRLSGPG